VHLACTSALLVQIGSVLWNGYIRPSVTNTVVEEKELKNMDFPLTFKICITPGFNDSALQEAGYKNANTFFNGQSMYNHSSHGWAGHTRAGGVQGGVEEVINRVRGHTVGQVIRKLGLKTNSGEWINMTISNIHLAMLNYPDNCYTLNLAKIVNLKNDINMLKIYFQNVTNRSVTILVEGSSLACDRIINIHRTFSTGDNIKMERGMRKQYVVEMKKTVFVEEDPTKSCRSYPNPEHASYKDCDHQWMRDHVAARAPGLVPIWLAEDFTNVTASYDQYFNFFQLWKGDQASTCPLPCATVRTEIKEARQDSASTAVLLLFSQSVQVSTTNFMMPTLSTFLSDLGGSLGLWLGLGVVQAAEMVVHFIWPRLKKAKWCVMCNREQTI
jgi:hypothetical protein